jgi:murein DD-endopeptidase MepM/ murein hydrolase activator NlpD
MPIKKLMRKFLLILLLILSGTGLDAQEINDNVTAADLALVRQKAQQYYPRMNELIKTGQLPASRIESSHILFGWPLRTNSDYDDIPGYYMIQNYVDNDNSSGIIEYNCGSRTYDGHNGTDINIWPFWWHMMNNSYVQVVAAAPGIVITVADNNNNDDNCSCTDNNNNTIVILHADSSTSIYYHIKDNSALVNENDAVVQGQPIASVGSSGCSSNPHLHFEVRDKNNVLKDPWVGPNPATDCNNRNEETYWQNQKPYWEPQINRVMTHGSAPSLQGYNENNNFCPLGESVNSQNNFNPGNIVFIGIAMHDYLDNTSVIYTVYFPDGTLLTSNSHSNTSGNNLARWYLVFPILLPSATPSGTYKIAAIYQGATRYHYFTVNCISDYNVTGTLSGARGYIASNSIVSNATLSNGSQTKMQAANVIQFNPGFTATAGSTLKARIKDCNYSE